MSRNLFIVIASVFLTGCFVSKNPNKFPYIIMETNYGNIKIQLYDKTVLHSENFVKLVNEEYYNGQLFHRVIKNFMIQSGDNLSKNAKQGVMLGTGGKDYTIPAEFFPEYYHKKGALAAARQADNVNPEKKSSGSQFYIVQGQVFSNDQLNMFVQRGIHPEFTDEQKLIYTTNGGTPHLDYSYTVFGEVIEGLDVVEKISTVNTDGYDRPLEDVIIKKMYTSRK